MIVNSLEFIVWPTGTGIIKKAGGKTETPGNIYRRARAKRSKTLAICRPAIQTELIKNLLINDQGIDFKEERVTSASITHYLPALLQLLKTA